MKVTVETGGLTSFVKKVFVYRSAVRQAQEELLREAAQRLEDRARSNASGPPGPNIVTGQYVAGIFGYHSNSRIGLISLGPQANRLEYGFFGVDALGRTYAQAPRPHMIPAFVETAFEVKEDLRALPKQVWRSL